MKMHVSFIAVALAFCTTRVAAQSNPSLAFHDDFSSVNISSDKWTHDIMAVGIGNPSFQIVSPELRNSYIRDGVLYIKPTLTVYRFGQDILSKEKNMTIDVEKLWGRCEPRRINKCITVGEQNRPVITANLRSTGSIKYGRVEVVARLPKGDWLWPAIWMMPKDSYYGGWPRSGEIDIIEAAGNLHRTDKRNQSAGIDVMWSHLHYGPKPEGHKEPLGKYWLPEGTFADNYHKFWLDWTKDFIKIGVDDQTVLKVDTPATSFWQDGGWPGDNIWASGGKNAPFDQEFYLIVGVGVGGGFFWDDGFTNYPYPRPWTYKDPKGYQDFWKARDKWFPTWRGEDTALKIRSVHMWQY